MVEKLFKHWQEFFFVRSKQRVASVGNLAQYIHILVILWHEHKKTVYKWLAIDMCSNTHEFVKICVLSESSRNNFIVHISQCAIEIIIHHISGYFYFCNKKLNSTAKLEEKTLAREHCIYKNTARMKRKNNLQVDCAYLHFFTHSICLSSVHV